MIVVVGHPHAQADSSGLRPAGPAALAAVAAAEAGASVQLVGRIGDDDVGDRLLLALARAGVGHAALLRDPSRATPVLPAPPALEEADPDPDATRTEGHEDGEEGTQRGPRPAGDGGPPAEEAAAASARPTLDPGDVELGLRYLTDFRGLVLPERLPPAVVRVAAEAAAYADAELIVVIDDPVGVEDALPERALVLAPPSEDPDGTFASLVGRVAAAVDGGRSAAEAFAALAGGLGASRSG